MKLPSFPSHAPSKPFFLSTPGEPKSVLDLRRSSSPNPNPNPNPNTITGDQDPPDHLDDWDSLMRELGLNDDDHDHSSALPKPTSNIHHHQIIAPPPPAVSYSTFPPDLDSNHFLPADFGLASDIPAYSALPLDSNTFNSISAAWNNANPSFDFIDDLIQLAECFDTNTFQLGHAISARLNQRLDSPTGDPLRRAAFYFKEALQALLSGSAQPRPALHPDSSEIIQTIKAQKTFSSISPIPLFSSFTANQAVLDALDASTNVHVIDFDIGLGGQWASFMKALVDRTDSVKPPRPLVIRISAIVSDEYGVQSALIRENLTQFAQELNIKFDIDFIPTKTFECISFQAIKFTHDEKVAVILSPTVFRHAAGTVGFLSNLHQISPCVVVHVDADGVGKMNSGASCSSYRQVVIAGLEFYSTLLESLEAATVTGGGDWMRRIETCVVLPKIVESLEPEGRVGMTCKEALVTAGLRQVGVSQFAEFQAECLLRRVQVRGFHVVKRQAEMLLCWHDRPIVATSAWKY